MPEAKTDVVLIEPYNAIRIRKGWYEKYSKLWNEIEKIKKERDEI